MTPEDWSKFRKAYDNIDKRTVGAAWRGDEMGLTRSAAFEDALEELQEAFTHMHVSSDDGDTCALCGLDLRNEIHQRATHK